MQLPPTSFADPAAAGVASVPMPTWDMPYADGARSQIVATLQTLLRSVGYGVAVDGILGPQTMRAVESAYLKLASSANATARSLVAPGPAGLTVAQVIDVLQRAYAAVGGGRATVVVPGTPSEPDGNISMTPGDAAAFDRKLNGGSVWPAVLGIGGAIAVGVALWRALR